MFGVSYQGSDARLIWAKSLLRVHLPDTVDLLCQLKEPGCSPGLAGQ